MKTQTWKRLCRYSIFLLMPLWVACGPQATEIPERDYTSDPSRSPGISDASKAGWRGIKLDLDRSRKQVTFTLSDGSKIQSAYEVAPRDQWPSACPTNYSSSQLEVLVLAKKLTIDDVSYEKPALVADCFYRGPDDSNPELVHLVKHSSINSNQLASTCSKESQCVIFRTKIGCDPLKQPCN